MPKHITLPDNWQTHDELVKLLRNYDNDDTADADEMVAAFLAHHRSPAAPGCDCHLNVRQVCDTCQGVTGEEKDVEPSAPRVPQPGDRVRVGTPGNWSGPFTVEADGSYPGQGSVEAGYWRVAVIEPAPARGDKPEFADRLAEASRAAAEATFGVRPAGTGKETDR